MLVLETLPIKLTVTRKLGKYKQREKDSNLNIFMSKTNPTITVTEPPIDWDMIDQKYEDERVTYNISTKQPLEKMDIE